MTALALFECKKVARNPILWIGALLMFAFAWANARSYWPVIPNDARFAYEGVTVLAACALLIGAWVGLRDRVTGAEVLVASTPIAQRSLVIPARIIALSAISLLSYGAVLAAVTSESALRGGRGVPDLYLALDGGLYVALASCTGFGIGYLTGSRILSLLATPLLPGVNFYLAGRLSDLEGQGAWIIPNPRTVPRFAHLGYLPDVLPTRVVYLGALIVFVTAVLMWVAARRSATRKILLISVAMAVTGGATFLATGAWLSTQPSRVFVLGPEPSQWLYPDGSHGFYNKLARAQRSIGSYPDDGSASECVTESGMTVCVLPEYGRRLAEVILNDAAKLTPFAGLEGIPTKIRMIPTSYTTGTDACATGTDDFLIPSANWTNESDLDLYPIVSSEAFYCAVYGPKQSSNPAPRAVETWQRIRVAYERTGPEYLDELESGGSGGRIRPAASAMGRLPVEEVVSRLRPIWNDLRSGKVKLHELESIMER
jgi:hypothetical protein